MTIDFIPLKWYYILVTRFSGRKVGNSKLLLVTILKLGLPWRYDV